MSADSETASYISATALSDSERQPCPVAATLPVLPMYVARVHDARLRTLNMAWSEPAVLAGLRGGLLAAGDT
ncbi:hypothetical protein GCM10009681_27950 [Luedemannella helvata]|uniref:Uncharacterized protein n=1 Tax=Luedemannella helvata TaxID=349315 RepID=A0ABP4WMC8_9ACTN